MASDNDTGPVLRLSMDSLAFEFDRRISRSPLSIALDAASSTTLSVDHQCNHDGDIVRCRDGGSDQEIPYKVPTAFNSCDPIVPQNFSTVHSDLVDWEDENDPENPLHWPLRRKLWMSFMASFMTFGVSLASSIFSSDVHVTARVFGVSEEVMVLGVSLYVLGFACGPLVFGPVSELYGRSRPMLFGFLCFTVLQVPLAVAENIETILICRFLAGAFGAAPLAISPGILVDLWEPYARGIATLSWLITVYAGTVAGPLVGVFTLENADLGWRWSAWLMLMIAAAMLAISVPTVSETFAPILLQRKAARLRLETKNWALHSKRDEEPISYGFLARKYGIKPLQMLFQEPILACMTAFMSLVYAIMYLLFVGFPYSFENVRGWDPRLAALPFTGLFVGYLLGFLICTLESTIRYQRLLRENNGKVVPEERLPTMIAGSFVLVGGLFWFAWTSFSDFSWIPQIISSVPIGCGVFLVFVPGQVYLMDVYTINAASALAGNAFVRAALACAFPLFATPMYDRLGVAWGMSLLGFLCCGLCPFPILFYVLGHKIRSWSKYVPQQKDRR